MFKKCFLVALALFFGLPVFAEDFEVRIVGYPHEAIRGVPIVVTAEVCNVSSHSITVAEGYQAFSISVEVKGADGQPRVCPQQEYAKVIQGVYQTRILPADWREMRTFDVTCATNTSGEYIVRVIVSSTPPYFQREHDGAIKGEIRAWGGTVISKEVYITINEPAGVDREVYDKTKRDPLSDPNLLREFPTSTYAAYMLWNNGCVYFASYPEIGAERDYSYDKVQQATYQDSPSSLETARQKVRTIVEPWERLYREFPLFVYRPALLLRLSRCYFMLGEFQKAVPLLKELLKQFPDSEPGKKAVAYRDVLKAHELWPE